MSLQKKFNLVFITVFSIGLLAAGLIANSLLQRNARGEVIRNARLMMETALAARKYTNDQVKPLLNDQLRHRFLPQTVPAFAATENLRYVRAKYPEFSYKEATLNPTNPRDRAKGWEVNVVKKFRGRAAQKELVGVRDTPKGQFLYLSRPIRITNKTCLSCHTTPSMAPATQVARYGTKGGFGWKMNEVIGAQIVSVPMSLPVQIANAAFKTLMLSLLAVFAFTLVLLNVMLRFIVIQPVTRLSQVADEVSKGNLQVQDIPVKGQDEIAVLAGSFNRMRRSVSQAIRMLDGE